MGPSIIIYADLFFILQLLWNGYFLIVSSVLVNYHLTKCKGLLFLIAMGTGSMLAIPFAKFRILIFILEWCILYMVGKSIKLCITLFLLSAFAGGIWIIIPEYGWMIAGIGTSMILLYVKYIPKSNIYTVYCRNQGNEVKIKALYDTGNSLYLPGGKEMVSLVSYEAIHPVFDWNDVKSPKILPFSSIGNEEGLLLAVSIDSFFVLEKNMEFKNPYVGIVKQNLSEDQTYQMILHKDIFQGREM